MAEKKINKTVDDLIEEHFKQIKKLRERKFKENYKEILNLLKKYQGTFSTEQINSITEFINDIIKENELKDKYVEKKEETFEN